MLNSQSQINDDPRQPFLEDLPQTENRTVLILMRILSILPRIKSMLPQLGLGVLQFITKNALVLGPMAYLIYRQLHDPIGERLKTAGVDALNHYLGDDHLNATIASICAAFTKNLNPTDKELCPQYLQLGLPWLRPHATVVLQDMSISVLDPYIKDLQFYLFVACVATCVVQNLAEPTTGKAKKKALTYLAPKPAAIPSAVTEEQSRSFGLGRDGINL